MYSRVSVIDSISLWLTTEQSAIFLSSAKSYRDCSTYY